MKTYFAAPEKTSGKNLAAEIEIVSHDPVVSGLLHTVSGLLAVLDDHRQIIALNDSFLRLLGINDPGEALGLRPGEAVRCVHAHDEPSGCGTTPFCSTCGAAIAIVSSLERGLPVEKICALSTIRDGKEMDLALLVRSHPIRINRKNFLLLFIQDITRQQQRAALERTFFHDINNMLTMIVGASELLIRKHPSDLAETVHRAALRLMDEMAVQRFLSQSENWDYPLKARDITISQIFSELHSFFSGHPVARNKRIDFPRDADENVLRTDISLLLRVLCNMIINALEATGENGLVKVWMTPEEREISFHVWNDRHIPKEVALRIFQRNFSTKEQTGRGIGTYSMKLFGEKLLGGRVNFTTSESDGTTFTFACPR
ncbi:MAG: ATP-binding protein [Thermodesulfobacteriota bacterium]